MFSQELGADRVEYLIGYEGNALTFAGKLEKDLPSITAVHPMRKEAVKEFPKEDKCGLANHREAFAKSKLREIEYEGNTYYMRKTTPK